jgi:xylulokinase
MTEPGLVAIDIGTSAIRATVLGEEGSVLAESSTPTPTRRDARGGVTVDPDECWHATANVVKAAVQGRTIRAVCVAAQLGMVVVDSRGAALTPVRLWSDRTAHPWLAEVAERLSGQGIPPIGRRLAPEATGVRLRMLAEADPTVLERAGGVLSLKDYIVARLTGNMVTDATHASYTLVFDVARRDWSPELADRLNLPLQLFPEVRSSDSVAGHVTATAAVDCGLPAGSVVAVGGPDGTIGSLGAGAFHPGRTADIAGSTDVLVHVTREPLFDADQVITTNAHPLGGLWTIGGATGMTGGAVSWLAEVLRYPDVASMHEDLGPALAAVPPGSRGLLVDTALTGHRFPYWDSRGSGAVLGIAPDRSPAELLNAFHEGACFLVAEGLAFLHRAGAEIQSIAVVGGVARRPESLQLRASAWGVSVEGIGDGMATSRGAAMLAGVAGGVFDSIAEAAAALTTRGVVYDPDPVLQGPLQEAFAAWRAAIRGPGLPSGRDA